jgi:hypothetical protein
MVQIMDLWQIVTDVFILAVLLVMLGWDMPDGSLLKKLTKRFSRPIIWLGFSHSWAMFAPEPISVNETLRFEFEFASGQRKIITPPFFDVMGSDVYPADIRCLKIMHAITEKGVNALKPAFARYLARTFLDSAAQGETGRPRLLHFVRLHQQRPPWPPSPRVRSFEFFEENVYTHDFDRDPIWRDQCSADASERQNQIVI